MSPKIVITDELSSLNDWTCVERASSSGVIIIASCHGYSVNDVKKKEFFNKHVFERYVVLKNDEVGVVKGVYDGEFIKL